MQPDEVEESHQTEFGENTMKYQGSEATFRPKESLVRPQEV